LRGREAGGTDDRREAGRDFPVGLARFSSLVVEAAADAGEIRPAEVADLDRASSSEDTGPPSPSRGS
jgi:hypothetical protein